MWPVEKSWNDDSVILDLNSYIRYKQNQQRDLLCSLSICDEKFQNLKFLNIATVPQMENSTPWLCFMQENYEGYYIKYLQAMCGSYR